jgi:UDP-N-acetyl-D-galactosamine dehydrogenase
MLNQNSIIAIVGLGYVGIQLAVEFGKRFTTIGFDISENKISKYISHIDPTGEVLSEELESANKVIYTTNQSLLANADFIIIAVPSPVDDANKPNFIPLISASVTVGKYMKPGAIVIYESTVYPGATEEICIPVLEKNSKLKWKTDFNVAYSPERINPGDKNNSFPKIVKVVSADDEKILDKVANLYESVVTAGVYKAPSIRVAEAAKVIENAQRDLNIALMNELAMIFDKLDIDTSEVLKAASTKWNFLKFKPGLVGGHCIGVDPYYLTHKAEMVGYHPQILLAGRRINDGMGKFIAEKTIKLMIQQGTYVKGAKVIVFGLTFKEDCPDIRNSKVMDIIRELEDYGCQITVHDPRANSSDALSEYKIKLTQWEKLPMDVDAIILAVAHQEYLMKALEDLTSWLRPGGVVIDVKAIIPKIENFICWRL